MINYLKLLPKELQNIIIEYYENIYYIRLLNSDTFCKYPLYEIKTYENYRILRNKYYNKYRNIISYINEN